MKRARVFYGWVVVWSVHVLLFTIFGATYSFSSFFPSLQAEFSANRADVSFAFALAVFLYFSIGAFAGVAADRTHVRWVAGFGITCLGTGLYWASRAASLAEFYAAFGLAIGFGVGCSYVPAIAAVQPWFVKRRALAAGIASSGIGLGTLVVPLLSVRANAAFGWRATLEILAACTLVFGMASILLLEKSPQRKGLNPDDAKHAPAGGHAAGMGWLEAVRSRTFALFFSTLLVTGLVQFMPFVHLARHAQDRGLSAEAGALLLGIIGLGSFGGRFFLTGLADRFGRRDSYVAMFVLMGLSFAWWWLSLALPTSFAALALFAADVRARLWRLRRSGTAVGDGLFWRAQPVGNHRLPVCRRRRRYAGCADFCRLGLRPHGELCDSDRIRRIPQRRGGLDSVTPAKSHRLTSRPGPSFRPYTGRLFSRETP